MCSSRTDLFFWAWYTEFMKRVLYVVAFAFFGLIVHGVVELVALELVFGNPERFAGTHWWNEWFLIHDTVSNLLWFLGFGLGTYYGIKFWKPYGSKPGFYHWQKKIQVK